MAAYKYNGKSYRFLVNGQTGEVQGERPWSIWKIAFAVLLAALVAGLALYVAEQNGAIRFDGGSIEFGGPTYDYGRTIQYGGPSIRYNIPSGG